MPMSKYGLYVARAAVVAVALLLATVGADGVGAQSGDYDKYDRDDDGLIEIDNLEQLNAVRWDLDGDGVADLPEYADAYAGAFPGKHNRMDCPRYGCSGGYELTRSLDFDSAASYASGEVNAAWTAGSGWLPIGYHGQVFNGALEGNNFTIANLFIDYSEYYGKPNPDFAPEVAGLFGFSGGDIRGVGVVDADVLGGNSVGGLVGYALGGSIADSYVTGNVAGEIDVGGLVRWNQGSVIGSYATGDVSGDVNVGGLVGTNYGGAIMGSYATGGVSGHSEVGGLIGYNGWGGSVAGSYAIGKVSGDSEVGGLVGVNYDRSSVAGSYANGSVSGEIKVGGLVGVSDTESSVTGSYATGNVTGLDIVGGLVGVSFGSIVGSYATGGASGARNVGGLVGLNRGRIANSYATGRAMGAESVGGFAGYSEGGIVASYWDVETSQISAGVGRGSGDGVEGKLTAELQALSEYGGIYAAWRTDVDNADNDFNATTGKDDLWDFGSSSRYPLLKADIDGDGIATWQEFGNQKGNGIVQTPVASPASIPTPTNISTPVPPTPIPAADNTATPLPTATPVPPTPKPTPLPASISTPIPTATSAATPMPTVAPVPSTQTPAVVVVVATATPSMDAPAVAGGCNSAGDTTAGTGVLVMLAPLAMIVGARWRRKLCCVFDAQLPAFRDVAGCARSYHPNCGITSVAKSSMWAASMGSGKSRKK